MDGNSNYIIKSLPELEKSAAELANYNQKLTNNISSLKYIINQIQTNWENSDGRDIESIMKNLNTLMNTMSENIQPVIAKYVETLNNMVAETKIIQSRGE